MGISIEQIKHINGIIDKYADVIRYVMTGENEPDKSILIKVGVTPRQVGLIKKFFKYGETNLLDKVSIKNKKLEEVIDILEDTTLTTSQKNMLVYLKVDAGVNISNLAERIKYTVSSKLVDTNLNSLDAIRNVLSGGALTKTEEEIADELKELTDDWSTRWNMIAHTELWDAKIFGEATAILSGDGLQEKTRVIKRTKPTACKHCIKHYLMPNKITPRVFTIEELMNNGDNYGKPVSEWKPTLKTMHPNCMCELEEVPEGYEFDDEGNLVKQDSLSKSTKLTNRTVDKNNLVYVKKVVNNHGFVHEQGFWVKQKDAPKQEDSNDKDDANLQAPPQPKKPVDVTTPQESNLMGLNQHDGAGATNVAGMPSQPQMLQVSIGGKEQELSVMDVNTLPTKFRKYLESIEGFDFGTTMAIKNLEGTEKALEYLKDCGFDINETDKISAWSKAMGQIMQYNCVSGLSSKDKTPSNKIFEELQDFGKTGRLSKNDGDYARMVYEVTGRVYPVVGVYDEDNETVKTVAIQYGNLFFTKDGLQTMDELLDKWLKDSHNKRLPLVPLSLRKMVDNTTKDAWYYNGIRQKTAEEVENENKRALNKVLELLRVSERKTKPKTKHD